MKAEGLAGDGRHAWFPVVLPCGPRDLAAGEVAEVEVPHDCICRMRKVFLRPDIAGSVRLADVLIGGVGCPRGSGGEPDLAAHPLSSSCQVSAKIALVVENVSSELVTFRAELHGEKFCLTMKEARRRVINEVEVLCSDQPTFDELLDDLVEAAAGKALAGLGGYLTHDQMMDACRNIGHDLTCGRCAEIFFTGATMSRHDPTCATAGRSWWTHCGRRYDELDNYCSACGISSAEVERVASLKISVVRVDEGGG